MAPPKYPKVAGYELVQQIGGGGFSTVFRAVNIEEHRVAACKVVFFAEDTSVRDRQTVEKEMKIHAALKHKNVLEFLNAVIVELDYQYRYIPGIYMLLEFAAGGDLFDKIAPDVGIREDVALLYFRQLVMGMEYLHCQGVCHRDLKPENLLLDVAGTLKISDFGLSAVFRLKETGKTRVLTERCGSLPYVAPELDSSGSYQAEPVDVWGIGVILFTMLAGNTPWDEPTQSSPEFCRYLAGEIFDEEPWNRISHQALSLITGLLTVDPARRMTLSDTVQHPWFTQPSQLASRGVLALADSLAESLRSTGDLDYANPEAAMEMQTDEDSDRDQIMLTAASQFTQSLMLFSQTQNGKRYTPHLTRFYAVLAPPLMIRLVEEALQNLGAKTKSAEGVMRLRVGGYDRRKVMFKGWVELEPFTYRGMEGTFCVMARDQGNPISWRQLWKALIKAPAVEPHVLKK